MALAIGSNVAFALTVGDELRAPLLGQIVAGAAEPWTVLWANGQLTGNVTDASLTELTAPSEATTALVGQIVRVANFSPDLRGTVIAAFDFDGTDRIVVRSLANGQDYFFAASLASTENT
jgi:hypothetical protein